MPCAGARNDCGLLTCPRLHTLDSRQLREDDKRLQPIMRLRLQHRQFQQLHLHERWRRGPSVCVCRPTCLGFSHPSLSLGPDDVRVPLVPTDTNMCVKVNKGGTPMKLIGDGQYHTYRFDWHSGSCGWQCARCLACRAVGTCDACPRSRVQHVLHARNSGQRHVGVRGLFHRRHLYVLCRPLAGP